MLSVATDINDRGQIVGWSSEYQYAGYRDCTAQGINKKGAIVGECAGAPWLWRDGTFTFLPTLPGAGGGVASDINDRGVVAVHAFAGPVTDYGGHVWRDGQFLRLDQSTSLNDINDRGVAVGRVQGDASGFESHGAIWPKR